MTDVLLAAPGVTCEDQLLASAGASGVTILRRCVDAVDALAAVATFPHARPVVSAALPRMVAATIERLGESTVGLADDDDDENRLRALGVKRVVRASTDPLWPSLLHGDRSLPHAAEASPSVQAVPTPVQAVPPSVDAPQGSAPRSGGHLIAVWGPPGAPGRTTVAVALADALARAGREICLVDADTYAPGLALALGVQAPGICAACRHVDSGADPEVRSSCAGVRPRLSVLPGIGSPGGWTQLRTSALEALWAGVRREFDTTIVDVGPCVEDDEAGAPWARRRNAAAVTALLAADRVVVVARGSSEGAARLAAAWPDLPGTPSRLVVQNRAGRRSRDWPDAIRALGVTAPVVALPDDPRTVQRCWSHAATLSERGSGSGLARAVRTFAATLVGD